MTFCVSQVTSHKSPHYQIPLAFALSHCSRHQCTSFFFIQLPDTVNVTIAMASSKDNWAQMDKDNQHQQRILQHLTYDPQASAERYPWLIKDKYHQLSNRTSSKRWTPSSPQRSATSPTAVSDFEQSFLQFKTMGDPFGVPDHLQPVRVASRDLRQQSYQSRYGRKRQSSARKTIDVLSRISDAKQDSLSIYSPELETSVFVETPETPETPQRRTDCPTMFESPEEPIVANILEQQFEKLSMGFERQFAVGPYRLGKVVASNDPIMNRLELSIDEYSDAAYLHIMKDLQNNVQLRVLQIRRRPPTELRQRNHADLRYLYSILGQMSNLKELHLQHFEAEDLEALDDQMESSPVLKSLKVVISDLHV